MLHLCSGKDEDTESSEAMRKFKKTKQKKTIVSFLFVKLFVQYNNNNNNNNKDEASGHYS